MPATGTERSQDASTPPSFRIPRTSLPLTVAQLTGIPLVVVVFSEYALVTLLGLVALAAAVLWLHRDDRFWRRLFGFAAFYGTLGEALCVYGDWTEDHRGLWVYHFPQVFETGLKLPLWLPLVWGNLFTLFVSLASRIHAGVVSAERGRTGAAVRYVLALAVVSYAGLMFRRVDIHILYIFTPVFTAFLLYWNRLRDFVLFAVGALLGTFGEIWAMREGLWVYTKPMIRAEWVAKLGVDGIPVSLSMAWGLSAVFLYHMARRGTKWQEC